ncbi:MAG: hypothetical protein IPJ88_12065 [Myxococcales bacterium]|nr:MAG: hypothetical protein IPJ88_12065 [Myxococcales bacterium]
MADTSHKRSRGRVAGEKYFILVLGFVLILAFFALRKTAVGYKIVFLTPFTAASAGELYFLLSYAVVLWPGVFLFGLGFVSLFSNWTEQLTKRCALLLNKHARVYLLILFVSSLAFYAALQHYASLGFDLLDDIAPARFGGEILASGRWHLPFVACSKALPTLYLQAHDGFISSFDYLGGQLLWALSVLSRTGSLIFLLLSALTPCVVAIVLYREAGVRWAVVGGMLLVLSPMGSFVSVSNHPHIGSRFLFAVSLLFFQKAIRQAQTRQSFYFFFVLGSAMLFRPFEIAFLALPLALSLLSALPTHKHRVLALSGLLLPCLVFAVHNRILSGSFFVPGRFAVNELTGSLNRRSLLPHELAENFSLLWTRFGANLNYNLINLILWGLGPLLLPFFFFGAMRNRFARLLSYGLALELFLALLHDDHGLHHLGPIHYADALVPMVIATALGLREAAELAIRHRIPRHYAAILPSAALFCFACFIGLYSGVLREQALMQRSVAMFLDDPRLDHSVLLTPDYEEVWSHLLPPPEFSGSQVRHWPPSHPELAGRIVFADDRDDMLAELRHCFSDRDFYRLHLNASGQKLSIVAISEDNTK